MNERPAAARGLARVRSLLRGRISLGVLIAASAIVYPCTSFALLIDPNPPQIFNLYGEVGLLDMPSARFNADGEVSMTVSSTHTMDRYNLGFQALPWLETEFRYARLDRYALGSEGDLYDRSLGFKMRLLQEDDSQPNLAVGVQDILGTGAFGAEYFVASKKFGDFDFTGGIGWRRFGGGFGSFPNPFGLIFDSFKTLPPPTATGGTPLLKDFFHGQHAGFFGGVTWQSPIDGLQLIAELSGDDFQHERAVGSIDVKSQLNFGFSYEPIHGVQFGGGYFYGSEFGLRVTIHTNAFAPEPSTRIGTQPISLVTRSPDERADAVLDLVQDRTHVYSEPPKQTAQTAAGQPPRLADAVFDRRSHPEIQLVSVETHGDSLILDVEGPAQAVSCAMLTGIAHSAGAAGFTQIAVMSDSRDDVKICSPEGPATAQQPGQLYLASDVVTSDGPTDVPSDTGVPSDAAAISTESSTTAASPDDMKSRIVKTAAAQGVPIQSIVIGDRRIEVAFINGRYRTQSEAVGRLLRILMAAAPASVEEFKIVNIIGTIPTTGLLFRRSDIERVAANSGSAMELLPTTDISSVSLTNPLVEAHTETTYPQFGWGAYPGYRQSLFDPKSPYLFQIYAGLFGSVSFDEHFSIVAGLEANIYNDFGATGRLSNSLLPHVRSDFEEYFKHGATGIDGLEADYTTKFGSDVYARARVGYLESMYAGLGGEILWRPPHSRWAYGGDIYGVRQRAFNRLFGFRDYYVVTGHASVFYESPFYNLNFALYAGRYLARDYGATLQVTRRFASGIEIGAYATLTNVPFSVFGEGSFDKGFIIRIPLDFLGPINSQGIIPLDFSPLTRDGGQRLAGDQTLYYTTQPTSEGDLLENWGNVLHP